MTSGILMYEVDGAAFSRMTSKHYRSDCVVHRMDEQNIAWLYYYAKRSGGEKMTVFPLNDLRYSENSSGTYTGRVVVDNSGEGIIYTRVGRPEGRQTDILLILNTTISPVGSTIKTLRTQLIIVSVIMTAAALLLSFLLARKVSRPIIRINSGRQIAGRRETMTCVSESEGTARSPSCQTRCLSRRRSCQRPERSSGSLSRTFRTICARR